MKFILSFVLLFCVVFAQAQTFRVGVISDFEQSPNLETMVQQMIQEIGQTTGASREVILEATTFGIANIEAAQRSYGQWDSQVDLVLALGSITAKGLSLISDLSIPVVAIGIIDPTLQEISYVNGTSGKANFTYIWPTRNLEKELEAFNKIHDFRNVVVFVDEKAISTVNERKARNLIDSLSKKLNTELFFIPVGIDTEQVVNQLPTETDAAYFTVLLSQSELQIQRLINKLNERKIPTFSGNARLLDDGVLGSMANENDLEQVIRKLAIMTDEIALGSDLSSMPVTLDTKDNLYVNTTTARKIQLPIPFEVLFTATLIGDDEGSIKTYSFEEIAEKSLAANLNIQISYQDVELSKVQVKSARSTVLPSLEADFTASQINEERANAAFNAPEQSLTADLTFTQVIYSEEAIAAIKIAQYLEKAQEYNTEAEVLRVLMDTYTAYLNVLSAKTNVLIQRENLLNTRKNKELADIRVTLGSTNHSDLFRWESELAFANQSVIDAQTKLLAAKLQLNTLLANTLESEFDIEDLSLEDDLFQAFRESPLANVVKTPESLQVVSDFLVAESQHQNPAKKALVENRYAAHRQLTQNQRMLYMPTVAFQVQASQVLGRNGAGSTVDASTMALGVTELQDNSWFAGISLSLPIFNGFSRKAAIQQSKISLDQLGHSQTLLDQNLELGVRAGVLDLLSATTNIRNSNSASESARENFELVQENYKQGQVTIIQLIDAQQTALEARLAAAFSVYDYIQAHLQVEFSVGSFIVLMPEDQIQDFNDRLQEYLTNHN
uniref:TolC family protein n=1 Tax=Roseihalotalea indica TaxID=2867963 RepID=A0AA49Q010_9BACT|nr:TolC family protein [Tunicatimonas sp. TK19036]